MGRIIANKAIRRSRSAKIRLALLFVGLFGIILINGLQGIEPAQASGTIDTCGGCHGYPPTMVDSATRSEATGSFPGSHGRHAVSMSNTCDYCHNSPNWTTFNHRDGFIQMSVPLFGKWGTYSRWTSFAQSNAPILGTCNGVYCHSEVQRDGGYTAGMTYASPVWGSSGTATCGSCHSAPQDTGKHMKHQSWVSGIGMTTTSACFTCHAGAGDETPLHARGTINLAISSVYWGISTAVYSQANSAPDNGYGSCTNVYCHGGFSGSGGWYTNVAWTTSGGSSLVCGSCHLATSANPPTSGAHRKHSGNWTTALRVPCQDCHGEVNGAGAAVHVNKSVNWEMDSLDIRIKWMTMGVYRGSYLGTTGNKAPTANASFGSCTNLYCHSDVQNNGATAGPTKYNSVMWGSAAGVTCGSCHTNPQTTGGHTVHTAALGTTQSCSMCHYGAGDDTIYHADGTINNFMNVATFGATASYSRGSHRPGTGGYGNCTDTTCHGTASKNWASVTPAATCVKCHGVRWATTGVYNANNNLAAPGYWYSNAANGSGYGLDTNLKWGTIFGGVSNDAAVGAHDAHLRMYNTISGIVIGCNQCHKLPTNFKDANHTDSTLPAELTWGTWAKWNSMSPSWSTSTASCSNVYCHGGAMQRGDTSGVARTPVWTTGGLITGSKTPQNDCDVCHGAPPTSGTTTLAHAAFVGVTTLGACSTCHTHVSANGFTTLSLHMDGILNPPNSACGSCHKATSMDPPLTGSHPRHAGGWVTANQLTCNKCHGFNGYGTVGHNDGYIEWTLETTDKRFGANATYNGSVRGTIAAAAGGACNNTYCHSNVQNEGGTNGTAFASPVWGSSGSASCGTCHALQQTTGKHTKHLDNLAALGTMALRCTGCHAGAGDETIYHARGTINLVISTVYWGVNTATYSQGNHGPGTGYGSCSNVYCHGNWNTSGGSTLTPWWTVSAGGSVACGSCHAATSANPPRTGAHLKHAGNWTTALRVPCQDCHGEVNGAGATGHTDRNVQWNMDSLDLRIKWMTMGVYRGSYLGSTGNKAPTANASFGSCTNLYCHSDVQNNGATAGPTKYNSVMWGSAAGVNCGSCHTNPQTTGGHIVHTAALGTTQSCSMCHKDAGDDTIYHADGTINVFMNVATFGATAAYSRGSHRPGTGGYGNCTDTTCHGTASKNWASVTSAATCVKCHGVRWATTGAYNANNNLAAPGYWYSNAANGSGYGLDTNLKWGTIFGGVSNIKGVGAHDAHLRGYSTIMGLAIGCNQCHTTPANFKDANHTDSTLPAEINWGTFANWLTTAGNRNRAAWDTVNLTCANVYCHGSKMPGGDTSGIAIMPVWTTGGLITGAKTPGGDCRVCHGAPPTAGSTQPLHSAYVGVTTLGGCKDCHFHMASNGAFSTIVKHIDGIVQGSDCIDCHVTARDGSNGGPTRRNMSAEITGNPAWSHAKKVSGVWNKYACSVCHLEGDLSTGGTNTWHANNLLEFRDPDTGGMIKGVNYTWATLTSPGYYTESGTGIWSTVFERNTGNTTLEPFAQAVMINLCLKCHDSNGASSSAARVSGAPAMNPFGATWGTVLNMKSQFWTTNASSHPILGQQNNSYAERDTLTAPWGSVAGSIVKTRGTATGWGYRLTCWDCHDSSLASRTIGGANASVTAHGAATQVRAPYDRPTVGTATTQLCMVCHRKAVYFNEAADLPDFATGSAFYEGSGSGVIGGHFNDDFSGTHHNGGDNQFYEAGCLACHSRTRSMTQPARPAAAEDIHGYDTLVSGGTWSVVGSASVGAKPYAFFRATDALIGPTGGWRPKAWPGQSALSAGYCNDGGSMCTRSSYVGSYSPGGTY